MSKSSRHFHHSSTTQQLKLAKDYYHNNDIHSAIASINSLILHNSIQAHYILAMCYLKINKHSLALHHLTIVQKQHPHQHLYLLIAICYAKKLKYQLALQSLSKGILVTSDYLKEMLVYRGKIYMKVGQYQIALLDLKEATKMGENQTIDMLIVQCLRVTRKEKECLELLSNLLSKSQENNKQKMESKYVIIDGIVMGDHKIVSVYIYCLVEFNHIAEAQGMIGKVRWVRDKQQSSVYYYLKGLIEYKKSLKQECVLSWNEALNLRNNVKAVRSSLQELSIFYMKSKDFYESLSYLMREEYLFVSKEGNQGEDYKKNKSKLSYFRTLRSQTDNLVKLSESITYLMKKKTEEALALLNQIQIKSFIRLTQHYQFLQNLYYIAYGFVYFSLGKHKTSLEYYQMATIDEQCQKQLDEDNESNQLKYNISICKGIIACEDSWITAIEYFEKAKEYIVRSEPYFYIAVILIQKSIHNSQISSDVLFNSLQILNKGLQICQNSHMYFYRGVIHTHLGMNHQALEDVDLAIEKSQDNIAKYFYLRGIIFMLDHNYQQAIIQFSTCLSVDQHFKNAYLERGKCLIISQENQSAALLDIYEHQQRDYWKYVVALARRDFQQVANKCQNQNLKQIAFFYLGQFQKGGPAGRLILAAINNNFVVLNQLLDQAIQINLSVGCLNIQDILILKSYCLYIQQQYEQSQIILLKVSQLMINNQKYVDSEQYNKRLLMVKFNIAIIKIKTGKITQAIQITEVMSEEVIEEDFKQELKRIQIFLTNIISQTQNKKYKISLFNNIVNISDFFNRQQSNNLQYHFFIPMPILKLTQLESPNFQKLLTDFNIKSIENSPQAPWIRRGEFGVLFTNQVQKFDNLRLNTDQTESIKKKKIKEQLQLGSQIINKLNKIVQNEKQKNNTEIK